MPSKQSKQVMRSVIEENGEETVLFTELVETLQDKCGIAERSAETYIHDFKETLVTKNTEGQRVVSLTDGEEEVEMTGSGQVQGDSVAMEVGEATDEDVGNLAVLENVGHPMVPSGHDDYVPRRMGEESTALGKIIDTRAVANTMSNPDFSTLLVGKHGIGKDKLILHLCEKTNRPLIRLVGNDDADFVSLLVGGYSPDENGDFRHQKGLLTLAIEYGYVFMIDEFNALSGKVQTMLNMILEDSDQKQLVIPETNEVIEPHDEFRFVATMNPNEVGYGGREMLDHATSSRFFPIDLPPLDEEAERRVVASQTDWSKDSDALDMLLRSNGGIVSSIRNNYEMGNISTWVSTRDVIQIAQMSQPLDSVEAATEMVLTGRATPEDEEAIRSTIRDQNW